MSESRLTVELIKSLRSCIIYFDRCCWSRDDHRDVLSGLERQAERITTLESALQQRDERIAELEREIETLETDEVIGPYRASREALTQANAEIERLRQELQRALDNDILF